MPGGDPAESSPSPADVIDRVRAETQREELIKIYLTLAQLNQAVVRAVDVPSLYEETCRIAVGQGGYAGAMVAVPDADGRVVLVAQAGRLGPYLPALQIVLDPQDPRGLGPTAVALRENTACFSPDVLHDEATAPGHERDGRDGIRASASLPLRRHGRAVAALTLYSEREGAFDLGVGALFEQVAENVSRALDGFAAAARLEHETAQRRDLVRRLLTAQETERARIAADIHDDPVQSLAAVELRLGLLRRRMGESAPDLVPMVDAVTRTIQVATASLRGLLVELEPAPEGEDWSTAMTIAVEQVFEDLPVTWSLRSHEDADVVALAETQRVQVMHIVKEALTNVRHHAGATKVDLDVVGTGTGVEVSVTDDGVGLPPGLDPDTPSPRPGQRGITTMLDRASAAGGWCRLERLPTGGTRLRFFIPAR